MSDWGQGAKNNNIGWGQGAVNNNISWGKSHELSFSGDTEIVGKTIDPSYQAILDYAITQGYTLPSEGQRELQNKLVVDLKQAGIWNKLDTFAVFATDGDSDFALIDWIRLTDFTAVNSPTFTVNEGFQGDNVSAYIDLNISPFSAVNYKLSDASLGAWYNNVLTRTNLRIGFGVRQAPNVNSTAITPLDTNRIISGVNNDFGYDLTNYIRPEKGYFVASKNNLDTYKVFLNDNLIEEITKLEDTFLTNFNFYCLAYNSGGLPIFSADQISILHVGANLNNEISDFYTAINNYLNAL